MAQGQAYCRMDETVEVGVMLAGKPTPVLLLSRGAALRLAVEILVSATLGEALAALKLVVRAHWPGSVLDTQLR